MFGRKFIQMLLPIAKVPLLGLTFLQNSFTDLQYQSQDHTDITCHLCLKKLFLLVSSVHCFCTHFFKVILFYLRKNRKCWCVSRGQIARSRFPPRGCSYITTRTLWEQCKLKEMECVMDISLCCLFLLMLSFTLISF